MWLDSELKAGKIKSIERQVNFELLPKPNKITYRADFVVEDNSGTKRVVEAKGYANQIWRIKYKLFKHFFPNIEIEIF
jgi:hypothetical protein